MPEIDLEPREYRPAGKPREMSVRWILGWLAVDAVILGWGWFNREAMGYDVAFAFAAIAGILGGMLIFGLLKDIY